MTTPDYSDFLRVAEEAARAAGAVAAQGFRGKLEVRSKGGTDIVTQYDTMAQEEALRIIRRAYPDHAILAEESPSDLQDEAEETGARWLWLVDPIDGTHNYAMQIPFWCVSVAVADARQNDVVAAVVYDPLHNELFTATRDGGAFLNGEPIRVSGKSDLAEANLAHDIGYEPVIAQQMLTVAKYLQPKVKRLRLLGSAVLAITYVAAGRFDAYFHLSLQPWDVAAASLMVREAGGTVSNWHGGPLTRNDPSAVLASPDLHPRLLSLLAECEIQAK